MFLPMKPGSDKNIEIKGECGQELDPVTPDSARLGKEPEKDVGSTKREKYKYQHLSKLFKEFGSGASCKSFSEALWNMNCYIH